MEILKYRKDVNSPWQDIVALVGPQGEPGKDGLNGKDGVNGKDGYTPVKGVDYFDGEQGPQGEPGRDGANGKDGVDGKTPVKGTDYYTEADKQEMVGLVLAALPVSEEVSF